MNDDPIGNNQRQHLVILGAGYIGSALAREARAQGYSVTALTRNEAKANELNSIGVRTVVVDLASDAWHEEMGRADWVVNCVSSGGGGIAGYQHSYIDGFRSIERWLHRIGKVDTLVYTSSTSVYPQTSGVVTETSSVGGSGNAELLVQAEQIAAELVRRGCTSTGVVLRLAGIYGPGRHHLLDQLRTGSAVVPGKGEHRLNLIHRDDAVSAILAVRAKALAGELMGFEVFNVADSAPTPKCDLIEWLAQEIGAPVPSFSGEPVPGRRPDPPDRIVSNEKIKARLGWQPRFPDFKSGYAQILGA